MPEERTTDATQELARYRALIEQLPAIVYTEDVVGPNLQVVFVNARVRTLLGITPEEWVDDPDAWARGIHPDDREAVLAENARSERTGEPFRAEYRMIARDGRVLWFADEAVLVHEEGRPAYWQGVMLDVTPRKEAEARLAEAEARSDRLRAEDEVKTTFLQAVSHDLRTPLAAILGLAVTLERDDVDLDPEEARDLARRIANNARRLDRIVRDLLDLERLRGGVTTPRLEPVDLGARLRELVAHSDLVAGRRLAVDVAPLTVRADPAMVDRIVENLLANAVKHTPDDARIWVRLEPTDDGALIVVEDDGPGVPPEERERAFEAFRHGDGAGAGTGVGLALVARFAKLHGGRAWVEERPGGGASFRVRLAAAPGAR